jgi:PAS domain S-box-containing protein
VGRPQYDPCGANRTAERTVIRVRAHHRQILAYLAAPVLVGIAVVIRNAILGTSGEPEPDLLLSAVAVVGAFGGLGPALVAMAVGLLEEVYFRTEPVRTFLVPRHRDQVELIVFVMSGIAIGVTFEVLRRIRQRESAVRRTLAMITHCNEATLRATTEEEIYADICKVIVGDGGYRMCWVGVAEDDARKTVRPVAHAGHEDGYLKAIDVVWADEPSGGGPTGTALREGRIVVGRDFATDPTVAPWKEEALRRGYRSATSIPVAHDGQMLAVISMYSGGVAAFSRDELRILTQLSNDIAFGLNAVRQRAVQARQEFELRGARAQLSYVLEGSSDGFWDWDVLSGHVTFGQRTASMLGYELGELEPNVSTWDRLIYPDDSGRVRAAVESHLRGESGQFAIEHRALHKDGRWIWVLDRGKVVERGEDGKPKRMAGTYSDVTERKQAEESLRATQGALQQSEQRFRDVAASADEYVFEMDTQGVVTYISEVVERVLGYRPEEVVGKSFLLFMGPEERAMSASFLGERVSRGEGFSHFEHEARHRNGHPVWLDASAVPVRSEDGSFVGYRGAALDVSRSHLAEKERTALQAQLAESQKLESIGRLAGGIAHDFNNLLTVILSFGGEAREDVRKGKAPELEVLDEVMAAAKRATDLTRQLLAFARRQTVAPVILDLNEQVRAAHNLVKRVIGEDVRVVERLQVGPWFARCDPGLLGQVMVNLAVNARDAMPGGGTLTFSTRNVTVLPGEAVPDPAMEPGDYVLLQVEDTGTGMTPEVLARAFEPFFTTKGPGQGTGLGLATVYGIVKQSGACIGVRSTPGKGTTYDIFFPRQDGEPASLVLPSTQAEGGDETVLVVEDDPSVRAATVRALEAGGYRVLAASSAGEALDLADAQPGRVHVLLTDVVMPGRGGPEIARLLVEKRPDMGVLYMSGYSHDALGVSGVLGRGTNFIGKPFAADALRTRVREVLASVPVHPKS